MGTPGALKLRFFNDNGGVPGSGFGSEQSLAGNWGEQFLTQEAWMSPYANPVGPGTEHIKVWADSADNDLNYWEVLTQKLSSNYHLASPDNSNWTAVPYALIWRSFGSIYYTGGWKTRSRKPSFFTYKGALYYADFDCLKINGDQGVATAFTANSLTDTTKTWITNEHKGAIVILVEGDSDGQYAVITSNTGTQLNFDRDIYVHSYVTKPFGFLELMARVEALLRRAGGHTVAAETVTFGDVEVDFKRAEVRKKGELVEISPRELRLLRYFLDHRGQVVTREQLLDAVWDYDTVPLTRTVDMHVMKLRKRIEDDPAEPRWIVTVHRMGYKFAD